MKTTQNVVFELVALNVRIYPLVAGVSAPTPSSAHQIRLLATPGATSISSIPHPLSENPVHIEIELDINGVASVVHADGFQWGARLELEIAAHPSKPSVAGRGRITAKPPKPGPSGVPMYPNEIYCPEDASRKQSCPCTLVCSDITVIC
ncbi:hypothetical protein FH063_004255 [Azospirillum argentinense]|uniref:Uncharacterized protein n=2 Tax=Azospirillum argentinense TaxID=2970906 RepID=A0A5B0KM51_9PROT|nr:hypothetical protein FH063_004255 [Azospirillum argentinense]